MGVDFAVESGAVIITLAMGAVSHPDQGTRAYREAYERGVLVVAVAG